MSTWRPDTRWDYGWWAVVFRNDFPDPYWRGSRITRAGAWLASRRMARKIRGLEAMGKLP